MFDYDIFSRANIIRCESPQGFNHKLQSWSLSDWYTATSGELGEAGNVIKKLNRLRDGLTVDNKLTASELKNKLMQEIGDTGVYLDLMSARAGFNFMTAIIHSFNLKSREIGYPALHELPDTK